jgi:hypothetical protein
MKQLAKEAQNAFQKDIIIGELRGLLSMLNMDVNVLSASFETLTSKTSTDLEKQTAIAQGVGEVVSGIGQTIFQNEQVRLQNQLALNSEYYNNLIEQASGNAEQQELLRREQLAKERKIRQEQAENQRKASIFDIITNTAVAIVKTFANLGFLGGIAPAAAMAALGAAKVALVSSQPIPQFKHGRKGGDETFAILGDGYKNEPILDKSGNLKGISPAKPTLMHLDKGDSVLPSMDKLMLSNVQASANRMVENNPNKGLDRLLAIQSEQVSKGVLKALKKAKFVNINNTKVDLGFEMKKQRYKA